MSETTKVNGGVLFAASSRDALDGLRDQPADTYDHCDPKEQLDQEGKHDQEDEPEERYRCQEELVVAHGRRLAPAATGVNLPALRLSKPVSPASRTRWRYGEPSSVESVFQ